MIKVRLTSKRKMEKILMTRNASCSSATIAATANRHSKRMVTYTIIPRLASNTA
ncbi:hypothetical protein D3C80_1957910 [compost metagenome]